MEEKKMKKFVRYNGGTQSYYSCSDPKNLVIGKEYEVTSINVRNWQTDYTLKGINGNFNSVWFDDILSEKETVMAFSSAVPKIGEKIAYQFVYPNQNETFFLINENTEKIEKVKHIINNIYLANDSKKIYIFQVI